MGGISPAKERTSPKPWERANPGKLQEGKVQCGWIPGMRAAGVDWLERYNVQGPWAGLMSSLQA